MTPLEHNPGPRTGRAGGSRCVRPSLFVVRRRVARRRVASRVPLGRRAGFARRRLHRGGAGDKAGGLRGRGKHRRRRRYLECRGVTGQKRADRRGRTGRECVCFLCTYIPHYQYLLREMSMYCKSLITIYVCIYVHI